MSVLLRILARRFSLQRTRDDLSLQSQHADCAIAEKRRLAARLADSERRLALARAERAALRRRLCGALYKLRRLREQAAVKDELIVELAHQGGAGDSHWESGNPKWE